MCVGARSSHQVLLKASFHLVYCGKVFLMNPDLANIASLASQLALGVLSLLPEHNRITSELLYPPSIFMGLEDSNSSPETCSVSTPPKKNIFLGASMI